MRVLPLMERSVGDNNEGKNKFIEINIKYKWNYKEKKKNYTMVKVVRVLVSATNTIPETEILPIVENKITVVHIMMIGAKERGWERRKGWGEEEGEEPVDNGVHQNGDPVVDGNSPNVHSNEHNQVESLMEGQKERKQHVRRGLQPAIN